MMAAEEYLGVFQGVKHRVNTSAVLPKRATPEHRVSGDTMKPAKQSKGRGRRETARQNAQILTAPQGCEDNGAGGCVGFVLTDRMAMRARNRLACGPWLARPLLRIRYGFPRRPLCDLISAYLISLNVFHLVEIEMPNGMYDGLGQDSG